MLLTHLPYKVHAVYLFGVIRTLNSEIQSVLFQENEERLVLETVQKLKKTNIKLPNEQ